ncbi:MAG TPA: DoxX-like family protein, partial [Thermoanaerobaculia bacterium]
MSSVSINPALLRVIRFCVAAVWIYEGLFQKIVGPAEHELAVVQSLPGLPVSALTLLRIIGIGETLLGIAVASGLYARPLAIFQGLLLITMNGLGIALGGGAIADPVGRSSRTFRCSAASPSWASPAVHRPGPLRA